MGLLSDAAQEYADRRGADTSDDTPARTTAEVATAADGAVPAGFREAEINVGGETVAIDDIETVVTDDNSWLVGRGDYGHPRDTDALEARQIVQTSAMQAIVNGINQNLIGGQLTFETNDDVFEDLSPAEQRAAEDLRALLRDVLTGPHIGGNSLDDLVVAAVDDMVGPGEAVWELLGSADGSVPVAAMKPVDPLTIRKNVTRGGAFDSPPYYQAPGAFQGGTIASLGSVETTPLGHDDLAVMAYPFGTRSYTGPYPVSPSWQVKEWLEVLANSTTHHNRFYADNEIPPGIISLIDSATNNSVDDLKERIEAASGDPRDVPVVEGSAQWIDMGGTAVNLNIIQEQEWFFFLCLGSLGLGKQELGFIEDVNRSNGEVEATRVYKQVTGPFVNQFEEAMLKVCRQFDAFRALGEPFTPTLSFSDPREERAREQRLREQYQQNVITLEQYINRAPVDDLADDTDDYVVEVAGTTINYAEHPKWVAQALINTAAGGQVTVDDEVPTPEEDSEPAAPPVTVNGHGSNDGGA